jgi:hypothetical protein
MVSPFIKVDFTKQGRILCQIHDRYHRLLAGRIGGGKRGNLSGEKKKAGMNAGPFTGSCCCAPTGQAQSSGLLLQRRKVEGRIEGAEADDGSRQEDDSQNTQDDGQNAGDDVGEVKDGDGQGDNDTNDTICGTQILSHDFPPFRNGLPTMGLTSK